jgi:cyclophilin family peptidyl-prolyl cis-trans isomerase
MARAYAQTNRGETALAILDGLIGSRNAGLARRALYDRAKTLHTLERFEAEAQAWTRLSELAGSTLKDRYAFAASTARELIDPWTREQAARAEDDAKDLPLVELRTNRGRILLALHPDDVPKAVAHFLTLVRSGFYDDLRFHRVIGAFTAQTGDPKTRGGDCTSEGVGSGSSEARIEIEKNKRHGFWRGAVGFGVGMVQANGSQFFILTAPTPGLDKKDFTCFGHVLSGMDVVDRIEWCDTLVSARVLREEDK